MKELSKDEFYKAIGKLDAITELVGNFPYTTHFKMRASGRIVGTVVDSISTDPDPDVEYLQSKFYLPGE
jgi:hypothetical protein